VDVHVSRLGSDEGEDVGKGAVKVIVSISVVTREDENKEAKVRRKVRVEGGKAARDSRIVSPLPSDLNPQLAWTVLRDE
jgi:hypothetical protein